MTTTFNGWRRAGFALAILLTAAAPAAAQTVASLPGASAPVLPTGEARPVLGWVKLCERQPAECLVNTAEPAAVALTPRLWTLIVSTNRQVNETIEAVTDQEHWGVPDRWDFAEDGAGDCEDFQLLKRRRLAEAGLPRRAMRMTVVIDEKGEGHAVLMIRTDRGDFVLDNKRDQVLPWYQTGYVFVKREGQAGQAWVSLGGVSAPTVLAQR